MSQMNTSDDRHNSGKDADPPSNAKAGGSIPFGDNSIDSRDLFAAGREITIVHGEDIYRLRLTAQNKLILTK